MGGIERNTVNLANAMLSQGHEVHILCFKKRLVIKPDDGVILHFHDFDKINRLTIIGYLYDLLTRLTLASFIRKSGFVWRGVYYGIYFKIFLYFIEKKYGKFDKIIARGQGSFEPLWLYRDKRFYQVIVSPIADSGNILDKWYKKLLFRNKNTIANSSGVRQTFLDKMSQYNIEIHAVPVIHNPCPIKAIQQKANEKVDLPGYPFIVHVGRLTYQKNQQLLIRAYAAANIEEKLVIIGSGQEENKLRELTRSLDISDKVIFLGQKENPYPWMKHARLFVLTSIIEGFGLVNVESLACGTPVIATDCPGGLHDIFVDELREYIVAADANVIAEKIRDALQHPITIKPEWYERFDAEKVAKQFLAL